MFKLSLFSTASIPAAAVSVLAVLLLAGCGNGEDWSEQHGYGPVEEPVDLGAIDVQMAREGLSVFNSYCIACHSMDAPISGPALRPVLNNRTPEYTMNYMLNPVENRQNHPVGQELSEQYPMTMVDMGLEVEEARAIYEFFRYYDEHGENPPAE